MNSETLEILSNLKKYATQIFKSRKKNIEKKTKQIKRIIASVMKHFTIQDV